MFELMFWGSWFKQTFTNKFKMQVFCVLHARLCVGLDWIKIRLNFKQDPFHMLCLLHPEAVSTSAHILLSGMFPREPRTPLGAPGQLSSAAAGAGPARAGRELLWGQSWGTHSPAPGCGTNAKAAFSGPRITQQTSMSFPHVAKGDCKGHKAVLC